MKAALLTTIVLLSAAALLLETKTAARLRAEHDQLVRVAGEAQRLSLQNQQIRELRTNALSAEQLTEIQQSARDIYKLRNELTQLHAQTRWQTQELARARAENNQLRESIAKLEQLPKKALPADYHPAGQWRNEGLATPEGTLETYFWASKTGNIEQLIACASPDQQQRAKQMILDPAYPEQTKQFAQMLTSEMARFPGYRIAERTSVSPDEVIFGIQSSVGGSTRQFRLKRFGGEWRVEKGFQLP